MVLKNQFTPKTNLSLNSTYIRKEPALRAGFFVAPPNPPRKGGLLKVSPTGGDLEGAKNTSSPPPLQPARILLPAAHPARAPSIARCIINS